MLKFSGGYKSIVMFIILFSFLYICNGYNKNLKVRTKSNEQFRFSLFCWFDFLVCFVLFSVWQKQRTSWSLLCTVLESCQVHTCGREPPGCPPSCHMPCCCSLGRTVVQALCQLIFLPIPTTIFSKLKIVLK